jgi:hypothetical protein
MGNAVTRIVHYDCPECTNAVWAWAPFEGVTCLRCSTGSADLEQRFAHLALSI